MKNKQITQRKGFTVIEVALVIAIAGLIFLMVFVALPGLRALQRDTQRRENMTAFIEAIKKYQQNNRGALPTGTPTTVGGVAESAVDNTWQGFYNKYLGNNFVDPDGEIYNLTVMECNDNGTECKNEELAELYKGDTLTNRYALKVVTKAKCSGDRAVKASNPRNLAVLYKLDRSGVYCTST